MTDNMKVGSVVRFKHGTESLQIVDTHSMFGLWDKRFTLISFGADKLNIYTKFSAENFVLVVEKSHD